MHTDTNLWINDASRDQKWVTQAGITPASGQLLLCSPENHGDRLLILSRLMMLLPALLLGWCLFSWCRSLYGEWAAMTAITLYAFCPNILAHARLITPDIALTAFLFTATFFFWKVLKLGRMGDAVAGGVALGLALLSKYTGVLLIPIFIALAALWWFKNRSLPWKKLAVIVALGFAVLLAGYRVNLEPYFFGIVYQQHMANPGWGSFLFGQCSSTGWWYYALAAFVLKTPIAAMFLMALAFVPFLISVRKGAWLDAAFVLLPASVIVGFFTMQLRCIGLRYILPAYPFLFVFAGSAAPMLLSKKITAILYAALIAWYIGASVYIHPHYLAYFNELAGGPDNGYRSLVDSNIDWGQDLKGLGRYMREHGIPKIFLSYFGTDIPDRYGIAYDWLPSFMLRNPDFGLGKKGVMLHDYVAISATNLQGVYFSNKNVFAAFREALPVAKIGYSIFIFHLDPIKKK